MRHRFLRAIVVGFLDSKSFEVIKFLQIYLSGKVDAAGSWPLCVVWTNDVPSKLCLLPNRLERQALPDFVFCTKVTILNPENQVGVSLAVGKFNIAKMLKQF